MERFVKCLVPLRARVLTLPVKKEYFEKIKSREKRFEYRLFNRYWKSRILGKDFDAVEITMGYLPKRNNDSRIFRMWKGYTIAQIKHKEFGEMPVTVFSIDLGGDNIKRV